MVSSEPAGVVQEGKSAHSLLLGQAASPTPGPASVLCFLGNCEGRDMGTQHFTLTLRKQSV